MTTTTAHPTHATHKPPLTADDMPWEFYGVHLSGLGEEPGEQFVGLGHIAPMRFVAAVERLNRVTSGDVDLADTFDTAQEALEQVEHRWAFVSPLCTWTGDDTCPQEADTLCRSQWELDEFPWFISYGKHVTKDTPGAFPVTLLAV